MLVEVRPSNEALLRARVPGAQDQRGCPSNPPPFSSCLDGMMGLVPQSEGLIQFLQGVHAHESGTSHHRNLVGSPAVFGR